ncbi:MAG: hypothetical protein ACI9XK_004094 [Granulosicoccus sp.]|jgi:hypothetical protein
MQEPDIDLGSPLLLDELTPAYFQHKKNRREMARAEARARGRERRHARYLRKKTITDTLFSKVWPMNDTMKSVLLTMCVIILVVATFSYFWLFLTLHSLEAWRAIF